MNERLPYEEQLTQQWNDLPLPDENRAWEDMKHRLEEDDDNIIPFWLRGCGLWGLLAIILLATGWWLIRPDKWWNEKQATESTIVVDQKNNASNKNITGNTNNNDTVHIIKSTDEKKMIVKKKDVLKNSHTNSIPVNLYPGKKKSLTKENSIISATGSPASLKKETSRKIGKEVVKKNSTNNNKPAGIKEKEQIDISTSQGVNNKETNPKPGDTKNDSAQNSKDSLTIITSASKKDSVRKILTDSIKKKNREQITKTKEPKKDSSNPKSISFSAGIAIHQQLPVAGQKLTPYNAEGRKSSLADYIPAVYFRMYKNDKWFLQAEFRYGAPQYTKEFLYRQNIKIDTGSTGATTTTSSKLKKTFYHQLPLTFNYFVLPDWSIGTGIVWNKFSSAVSEQAIDKRSNATGVDSLVSNQTIKDKNDSVFAKSYFQAVFETQYRWRRFSFGARYSFGLDPYIKFTLPGGVQQEEKNSSLQVFLRYELWRSRKK